jgi:hypothetical protein
MYKLGKPLRKTSYKIWLSIVLIVAVVTAVFYFAFVTGSNKGADLKNNNTPLVTRVGDGKSNSTIVNEPLFTMNLIGSWKETSRNSDPAYKTIQWNDAAKNSGGRWVRIYVDTIPADLALNYLLPVAAYEDGLSIGPMSENCASFTQGATSSTDRDVSVPISQESLPARWQAVSFMCENSHVSHQLVGTGSSEGSNAVTVTGKEHGKHKYFFLYNDANYHPDYTIFTEILDSFKAK